MTAPQRERALDFEPVYHHYGPHRAGLPPLIPYFRELWHRRSFAAEMSKAVMRGSNTSTFFGQLWLIMNPLLLAGVYYLLVTVIRGRHDPEFFTHLCLSLFAFNLVSTSITSGATSVTSSGKLLMNTPFPRLLIPLAAVRTAFFRFLPTVPVYFIFHLIFLTDVWHPKMLLALYFLGTMVLFGMGCAALFATLPRLDRPRAIRLAESCAGPKAAPRFELALDLLDLLLSRLARAGLQGPPPEAAPGEAQLLSRLAPHDRAARAWAERQALSSARARQGKAVNLDPAALVLDMLLQIEQTARTAAAA